MAKGHLLITPTTKSKDDDDAPARQSCFRQLTLIDGTMLLLGIQLALMTGYLLHLTTSNDARAYAAIATRVHVLLIVVPIMIVVVMLTVFGFFGKRLWMIVPNVLAQLALVVCFIVGAVFLGKAVANFPIADPQAPNAYTEAAQQHLYNLKVWMALSIVALIFSLFCLVVVVLCFVRVYQHRNDVDEKPEKNANGY